MPALEALGWDAASVSAFEQLQEDNLFPARVAAQHRGEYVLIAEADGKVRVYVDDQPVIDEWRAGPSVYRVRMKLAAGSRHRLRMDYSFQGGWSATARLAWRLPAARPSL